MKTLFTFCFLAVTCGMAVADLSSKGSSGKETGIFCVEDYLDHPYIYETTRTTWDDATKQHKARYYYGDTDLCTLGHIWTGGVGTNITIGTFDQNGGESDENGNWVDNPPDIPLIHTNFNTTSPFYRSPAPTYIENYAAWGLEEILPHQGYDSDGHYFEDNSTRYLVYNAHSRFKMYNGGRGIVGSQVLHEVFGTAWHNNNKPWRSQDLHRVPPPGIHVCGDTLKVDPTFSENAAPGTDFGTLFVVGDAGSESDATPSIDDSCVYQIADMAYPLHVLARGGGRNYDLSDIQYFAAVPEFCVGQLIDFGTSWSILPPNIQTQSVQWYLSGHFVNEPYQYSSVCNSFWKDPDLLTNWTTSCWYIKDLSDGNCVIKAKLQMSNGQQIKIAGSGPYTVYRPTVSAALDSGVSPSFYADFHGVNPGINLGGDGDPRGGVHSMTYTATYNTVGNKHMFIGTGGIVQLLVADYSARPAKTFSDWRLDGNTVLYDDPGVPINPIVTSYHPVREDEVPFTDSPSNYQPFIFSTIWLNASFEDYCVFRPDGDDSIFVTLGIVRWSCHGEVAPTYPGSPGYPDPLYIMTNIVNGPDGPDDSDAFPEWSDTCPE